MPIFFTDIGEPTLHGCHFTFPDDIQAAATLPYETVPVTRDTAAGTLTSLTPWVEPQRGRQLLLAHTNFLLEHDPNYGNHYVFLRKSFNTPSIVVLAKPGVPLPPGLFSIREGLPTIIRHEVVYKFTPTVPLRGKLRKIREPSENSQWFKEYTPTDRLPNFYLSSACALIISNTLDSGIYMGSGCSILQPSVTGM